MKVKKLFMLMLCFVSINTMLAQTKTITGTVTDADNSPLPGVSVVIKGTTTGTETDFDGNYSIAASVGDILQFSFVGMTTLERTVGTSNTINVVLQSDNVLDEVVVVAYGTSSKEALTGAVTQIKTEDIEKRSITNLSAAIEGASPGVIATASGQPGSGQSIRIRGFGSFTATNAPLYVVDGIPINGNLANINPNDIENITILKDASSTALYGNKATNGVVLVTTKRGKTGKGELSVNLSTSIVDRSIPEYDRIDAFQYYPVMWESLRNTSAVPGVNTQAELDVANQFASDNIFGQLGYNPFNVANDQIVGTNGQLNPSASLLYNDFDWEGAITRTGVRRTADISYQGRTENADYFSSLR